ncbi:TonB-dependent receptor domain-containing protein [Pseudomonas aeruginosa]|uniref:TonB-dependent receptor domain-containing protein n=1 Tax=Pseudomonas aeruginosa TaxID=287 RepID=UPI003BF5A88D
MTSTTASACSTRRSTRCPRCTAPPARAARATPTSARRTPPTNRGSASASRRTGSAAWAGSTTNYRLSDRWTLTTGLRYQEDRIERSGNSVLAPRPLDYQKTFSAFLPKVSLAFAATPDWTVGGLVSRGYNRTTSRWWFRRGWRSRTPSTPRRPTPTAWSWTSTIACATTCG